MDEWVPVSKGGGKEQQIAMVEWKKYQFFVAWFIMNFASW